MSYLLFGTSHGRKRSLLDAILKVPKGSKVNDIFQIAPIKQLVRDYWFAHQWWMFLVLIVHLTYMTLYSSYSLDMIDKALKSNFTSFTPDNLVSNKLYLLWPLLLVVPNVDTLFAFPILYLGMSGKRILVRERITRTTNIDIKNIFNWPSLFLSIPGELMPSVLWV